MWPPGVDRDCGCRRKEVFINSKGSRLRDLHLSPFKREAKDRSQKELSVCQMLQRANKRKPNSKWLEIVILSVRIRASVAAGVEDGGDFKFS